MRLPDWIFAVGCLSLLFLIAALIVSITRPRARLWPSAGSSWKLAWMWGCTVVATGAGLVLMIVDYGSGPLDHPAWILAGAALVALGAGLADWGVRTLGRRTSAGLSGRFSGAGPYRWTRNPQYLGDILMTVGIVLVSDSWRVGLIGAGGVVCLLLAPLAEEKWLVEQYGGAYMQYLRRVPRLLGRRARWILALATIVGGAGACRPGEEREPAIPAAYGERFTLGLGESAEVGGDYRIRFARMSEDSRCPELVECVHAGNATAVFAVESRRGSATLTLQTDREPRSAAAMGGEVALLELGPRPVAGTVPDTAEYRATLIVKEAS